MTTRPGGGAATANKNVPPLSRKQTAGVPCQEDRRPSAVSLEKDAIIIPTTLRARVLRLAIALALLGALAGYGASYGATPSYAWDGAWTCC